MTLFPSREILRRRADIGLVAAFFVLLWLPTADKFLHLDHAPASRENRVPAKFPAFQPTLEGTGSFFSGLEAFFNDSFGFRRRLVNWEQHLRWRLFDDINHNASVLIGKADWLFLSDGRTVEDISGAKPFGEADLESWRTLLTGRRDWLRERGIRYLFVIPPDKQSIYPEHLPDWLSAGGRTPQRLGQFVSYMRKHSDLPIIDLRETLLDAKKRGEIYLHTDTHWNDRGAFAAFRRIAQELTALGIPSVPLDADAFHENLVNEPGGDLAGLIGRRDIMNERAIPALTPKPPLTSLEARVDLDILPRTWVSGTVPRVTENPAASGKIVMFRDSFSDRLLQFFALGYRRTVFVWQQNWDRQLIEEEKPDVVIDEIVERFLIFRNPDVLKKADEHRGKQVVADQ